MNGLTRQILRFGLIGGLATLAHLSVAVALVEGAAFPVLRANALAFLAALLLSYLGNRIWTFDGGGTHRRDFSRFALVALTCLAVNQAIVYGAVEALGWDYRLALAIVVLVIPAASFLLNRQWVFTPALVRPTSGLRSTDA
jgi:putative flippase GtrA